MKYIFLNLKRFDIPPVYGGVNHIATSEHWGGYIVSQIQESLRVYERKAEFAIYFPEAHIINAAAAKTVSSPIQIGCQSVYGEDTNIGGNFGAFTTNRTAKAMKALGVQSVLIGHCEERKDLSGVLNEANVPEDEISLVVNRKLNQKVQCAYSVGQSVLYCVGEKMTERSRWKEVLYQQITIGLAGILKSESIQTGGSNKKTMLKRTTAMPQICIAYEPVWAIGPGKTPPDREYISMVARYIKEITNGLPVVYGGGLKTDNASMLASIPEIDGGLIALTRFSGEIGFYPEEYLEIVKTYMGY